MDQCATSLFVCNLLVTVTFLYRRIRGNAEETTVSEEPETVTRSRARQLPTRPSGPAIIPTRIEMTVVSIDNHTVTAPRTQFRDSIPPPPLSPSSTFPDLPPRRRVETTAECHRRTQSQRSLMPLPCNLAPTDTFPDLPMPPGYRAPDADAAPVPSTSGPETKSR